MTHSGRPYRRLVAVAACAVLPVAACDADETDSADATQQIRLVDHAIEMPEVLHGPAVDLEIINDGAVAHELAIARIEPGTTREQILDAYRAGVDDPPFVMGDPGGTNLLGPGESVRYQRQLEPGDYVYLCPFPAPDGTSHLDHGMIKVFTVDATRGGDGPDSDLTVTLRDDAIEVPELPPGTHPVTITNAGTTPHEVYIAGLPNDADFSRVDEIGQWIEAGQDGQPPLPVHFPGGHQTIDPGDVVHLTMTFRPDHTYQFDDYTAALTTTAVVTAA